MTFLNRHRSRIRPVGPFAPSSLFFGGIPGAWYDPTDLSTMFQDSTGTTPVTAVEQPVGLILDKSQGAPTLGPDLVVNGDFSSSAGWTIGAGWSIGSGVATGAAASTDLYRAATVFTPGQWYQIKVSVLTVTAGSFRVWAGGTFGSAISAPGTYTYYTVWSTNAYFSILGSGFSGTIDYIEIRALPGNHASQSTAASRPTYRARYNALTQSETFTGAPWLTGSTSGAITRSTISTQDPTGATSNVSTVAFPAVGAGQFSIVYQDSGATYLNVNVTWSVWLRVASGTATIYLNVEDTAAAPAGGNAFVSPPLTLTTTWQRFTLTGTRTANTGNLGVFFGFDTRANVGQTNAAPLTVQVWGAQLLTAADVTATGNAYQRIAAATVYDTAPIFRPYLAFDGMDDSLSTAAINFTSTDQISVFVGATKSSDAALSILSELSADTNANAGSFYMAAPEAAAPNGDITFRSRGTINTIVRQQIILAAPTTVVITALGDIPGARDTLRVDGAVSTSISNHGIGTYGNYPLFIGRRNNASFPFNGRVYEYIIRGAASSTTEIADTELWVNARTGAY